MKKFFASLLVIVLLGSAFQSLALAEETLPPAQPLTQMYDFGEIDYLEAEIDWFAAGKYTFLHRHPGEDAMRFFLSFFTDESLLCINSEADGSNFPAQTDSYFTISLLGENGVTNGYIYFDGEKIKLNVFGPGNPDDIHSTWERWEGWFIFKDAGSYAEIEARWAELLAADEKNWQEAVTASQQNLTAVSDLQLHYISAYKGPFTETFTWGLCSFVREGEAAPTTAFFMEVLGSKNWNAGTKKVVYLAESVSEDNTLTFKNDRVLNFVIGDSAGKEYDRNFTTSAFFKAQMTVNMSGQLTAIYLTLHEDSTPHLVADEGAVDLSTLSHEYGTFPSHLFSVNETPAMEKPEEEDTASTASESNADADETVNTENTASAAPENKTGAEDKEVNIETPPSETEKEETVEKTENTEPESASEKEPVNEESSAENNVILLEIGKKEAIVFGRSVTNDVAPKLVNDRTMLPIRFVAEALGSTVLWDEENRKVSIKKEEILIEITIGSSMALVGDKQEFLDSPAFIENDRTYLPLRFVTENLGVEDIIWDEAAYSITIVA